MRNKNTGSVEEKFSGKMFTKDISEEATADNVSVETKPQSEVSVEPEVVENAPQATEAENVPEISEPVSESEMPAEPHGAVESTPMEAEASVSEPQILRHFPRSFEETSISTPSGVTLHYDISTGKSIPESLLLNEVEFARRYNSGGAEIWKLDDKFQNGNEYKNVRALLAQSTEDPRYVKQLGRIVMSVPFEDGKIHIVQGVGGGNPNEATVLLNGKEVARGTLTQTGPKIELIQGLQGGLLFPDTAYERAFTNVLPKDIIKEWELGSLPAAKQLEIVERMVRLLFQAFLVRALDILSEKEQVEFDLLLDEDTTTPQDVLKF